MLRFSEMGERAEDPVITDLMSRALENPDLLSLAAGFTDNVTLPRELISQIFKQLAATAPDNEFLQYGTTQGRLGLRESIGTFLSSYPGEENLQIDPNQVIVSSGSQQALYLAVQVLCDPGDIILVERPSYFVFLEMLKGLGVRAMSIPTLENGRFDFEELAKLLETGADPATGAAIKGIYLVSYFSNPSSRCLPEEEKRKLGSLVKSLGYELPVIEDSAYRELYFEKPFPARSVLSLSAFEGVPCLYLGTFTKPFATGLKVGFGVSTRGEFLQKMVNVKGHHDFGTANFNQAVVETVLRTGAYQKVLEHLRQHYLPKMRLLEKTLDSAGFREAGWDWDSPEGGLLLWAWGAEGIDTDLNSDFCKACIDSGVLYVPGSLCFADSVPRRFVRLSIGSLDPERMEAAARRFVDVARQFTPKSQ